MNSRVKIIRRLLYSICCVVLLMSVSACNKKPTATIIVDPEIGSTLTTFVFDGTTSSDKNGDIESFVWNLGDGSTSTDSQVSHVFSTPGEYTVSLTVSDKKGKTDTTEVSIEVTEPDPAEMLPSSVTMELSPTVPSYIAVANEAGDIYELFVPSSAVDQVTLITITALDTSPSNDMVNIASAGLKLEPDGLVLSVPATLRLFYGSPVSDPELSRIFQVYPGGTLEITPWQEETESGLSGKIYHFSGYTAGTPSDSRLAESGQNAIDNGPLVDSAAELEMMTGMLEGFGDYHGAKGESGKAGDYYNSASVVAEAAGREFLDQPIPPDPCGEYLNELIRYGRVVGRFVVVGDLASQFRARAEQMLDQCPVEGSISFKFYSQVPALEGGISDPVPFNKPPFGILEGGGPGEEWIGGPGFTQSGGKIRFEGYGPVISTITGDIVVEAPFDVLLNTTLVIEMEVFDFFIFVNIGQGEEVFLAAHISPSGTAGVLPPVEGFFMEAIPISDDVMELEFDFLDGDNIIEDIPAEGLGEIRLVWTLKILY